MFMLIVSGAATGANSRIAQDEGLLVSVFSMPWQAWLSLVLLVALSVTATALFFQAVPVVRRFLCPLARQVGQDRVVLLDAPDWRISLSLASITKNIMANAKRSKVAVDVLVWDILDPIESLIARIQTVQRISLVIGAMACSSKLMLAMATITTDSIAATSEQISTALIGIVVSATVFVFLVITERWLVSNVDRLDREIELIVKLVYERQNQNRITQNVRRLDDNLPSANL